MILSASLLIQIPVSAPGKARNDSPNVWISTTMAGVQDGRARLLASAWSHSSYCGNLISKTIDQCISLFLCHFIFQNTNRKRVMDRHSHLTEWSRAKVWSSAEVQQIKPLLALKAIASLWLSKPQLLCLTQLPAYAPWKAVATGNSQKEQKQNKNSLS